MESKLSSPEYRVPNPEAPSAVPAAETSPENPASTTEYGPSAAPELAPEQAAQAQASVASQAAPVTLPTPVIAQQPASQTAVSDDLPAVAGDDDLIEKEWVDKAKQIISATRDDPARREKEVGRLQADYLKKRYGKELGTSPE